MKILSINKAFDPSIAVFAEENKILFSFKESQPYDRLNNVLFIVDKLFEELNFKPQNIDILSIVYGPGSFTGTRIGVVEGKIIAYALKKPILPINSLELIAFNVPGTVNSIIPAGKNEYFIGKFKNGNRIDSDKIITLENLKKLKGFIVSPYEKIARVVEEKNFKLVVIEPENLIKLSIIKLKKGKILNDPLSLNPVYLHAIDIIFKKFKNIKNG